jgi:hypothetical protein
LKGMRTTSKHILLGCRPKNRFSAADCSWTKASTSAIFFNLNMYSDDVFNLAIGAKALYFWLAVMTDKPKCLDLVKNPCKILEYLINVFS